MADLCLERKPESPAPAHTHFRTHTVTRTSEGREASEGREGADADAIGREASQDDSRLSRDDYGKAPDHGLSSGMAPKRFRLQPARCVTV